MSIFIPGFAIGQLVTDPIVSFFGDGAGDLGTFQIGQSTTVQCTVLSNKVNTVSIDWSTTALSANISNREQHVAGGTTVIEQLILTDIDSGYCGLYTCSATDSNTVMAQSGSISLNVGE